MHSSLIAHPQPHAPAWGTTVSYTHLALQTNPPDDILILAPQACKVHLKANASVCRLAAALLGRLVRINGELLEAAHLLAASGIL